MIHKRGWETSEFWVTVFTVIGLAAISISSSLPEKWAAIAASISVASYSISRGLAKLFIPGSPESPEPPEPPKEV